MTIPNDQNLTDEQVLQLIEEANQSDDNIPEDIQNVDKGDQASQGKAAHAFAEQKRKSKLLAQELQRRTTELNELKTKSVAQQEPSVQPSSGANTVSTLMGQLTMAAMQNLGMDVASAVSPEAKELIRMERDRLYTEQMNMVRQAAAVKERVPQIVNEALAQYTMLGPEGTEAVKRRLQKYQVLQQIDPNVIRQEVTSYFGELTLAGANDGISDASSAGEDRESSRRNIEASNTAASGVKSGRSGVKPADRGTDQAKPATTEELAGMRKIGITDVKMYRAALARKHVYAGK